MLFHERLKALREDNDLTQSQLAEILGCTRRQYIRYEKGEQEMSVTRLRMLCDKLDISADYLLGLRKTPKWPR